MVVRVLGFLIQTRYPVFWTIALKGLDVIFATQMTENASYRRFAVSMQMTFLLAVEAHAIGQLLFISLTVRRVRLNNLLRSLLPVYVWRGILAISILAEESFTHQCQYFVFRKFVLVFIALRVDCFNLSGPSTYEILLFWFGRIVYPTNLE